MKKMLLGVLMAVVGTGVQAQDDASEIVKQATKAGVKKCLLVVKSVSDAVLNNRPHLARCEWSTANSDTGIFSCEVEMWSSNPTDAKYSSYASLSVTPTLSGKCAADYTTISQYIDNCKAVRKLSSLDLETKGKNLIQLRRTGGNVSNYLMEQAGHCTLIKHEMFIDESK